MHKTVVKKRSNQIQTFILSILSAIQPFEKPFKIEKWKIQDSLSRISFA